MDDILNWLLQGTLVALATAVLLRIVARLRARARYAVMWVALLSVLALPLAPLVWAAAMPASSAGGAMASPAASSVVSIPSRWWTSSAAVIFGWTLWSAAFSVGVVRAALALRRAKRGCRPFPAERERRLVHWNRVRWEGRATRLMISESVRSAAVLGCGSPVIAVAPSLLDQLTDAELDRVVIHEWAHVQRRDDVAHAAQLVAGAVAGWQPAVWWLNRWLHLEREVACDEMAVARTGSAKGYAACLARLASLPIERVPRLPAPAALSASNVGHRIVRILTLDRRPAPRFRRALTFAVSTALCGIALVAGGFRVVKTEVPAPIVDAAPASTAADASGSTGQITATGRSVAVEPESTNATASPKKPRLAMAQDRDARSLVGVLPAALVALHAEPAPFAASMAIGRAPADVAAGGLREPDVSSARPSSPQPLSAVPWDPTVAPPANLGRVSSDVGGAPYGEASGFRTSPWGAAADAGVAVGRGSQKAAVATATFFSRFGKKVASSF